ncbi:hypothetical protein [Metabacillus litoralis]|uniref:hypothetical protein n=1 Tax=Metabacillus litoralis TaxID=152268 RepID=UPI000EF567CA|nr:hypothetical protein [Metabacillus litoralis]
MENIVTFWEANSSNIIVSFIIGLVFFILGPIGLWFSGKKVKKERVKKAIDMLLDTFEGMLVNEVNISPNRLIMVFRSIERDIKIDLEANYELESLLEDLVLRFERSKHLDPNQKDKYYEKITNIKNELKEEQSKQERSTNIPRPYSNVFQELREANATNDQKNFNKLIDELEKKIIEGKYLELNSSFLNALLRPYMIMFRKPKFFAVFLIIYILLISIIFIIISIKENISF